jgi:flagellar hook assembly protein FlgD
LRIGYNLASEATINLTVYNIYGDVVWEYAANPSNGQGTAGPHFDDTAVRWDGRNSSGDKVLSGVYYIIVNNTSTGQTAKLKVAVIW